MPTIIRAALRAVPELARDRKPFDCNGTLRGVEGSVFDTGRMPKEWAEIYRDSRDDVVYTVMSYSTPIAWVLSDGTVVKPGTKYSVTTSRHMGRLYLM